MFDAEAYRPYVALCRKLALGAERRPIQMGDWYIDRNDEPRCIGWHPERVAYIEGIPIWLPRFDQLLAMLEEAGFPYVELERTSSAGRYSCRCARAGEEPPAEHVRGAGLWSTREEAAMRLWMAVTDRKPKRD
jgi:hypothetical protein